MTTKVIKPKGSSTNVPPATKSKAPAVKAKPAVAPVKPTPTKAKKPVAIVVVTAPAPSRIPVAVSKQAQLIAKLSAAPGATIEQMMSLTGWQAHSVRGTISGTLRKRLGLNVVCEPSVQGGERRYRIVASVAA